MTHQNIDLHYLLEQLGLSYPEAEIYLYLLQSGTKLGPEIYIDLKLDKSTCYRNLKVLIDKNLVYSVGESRNQLFSANPTDHLQAIVSAAQDKLNTTKAALSKIQSLIPEYINQNYKNKNITVINTTAGHHAYMEARLKCRSKLIRDLSSQSTASVYYDNYDAAMKDHISRRVSNGIFLHQLSQANDLNSKWDRTSQNMLKEVRILPSNFAAKAVFSSWDDYSALFSIEQGKVMGFMLRDPIITELLNYFFDYIWDNSQ